MRKIIVPVLAAALLAAAPALAQPPAGGRGPGGPPPGGPGGGRQSDLNKVVITGVVLAVDRAADRVTIAYEAAQALNWPAGTMPFAMARTGMLEGIEVGRKVRFTLANHRISAFLPDAPPEGPAGPPPGDGSDRRPPPR